MLLMRSRRGWPSTEDTRGMPEITYSNTPEKRNAVAESPSCLRTKHQMNNETGARVYRNTAFRLKQYFTLG